MILMDFSYFFLLFSGFLGGVWGAVLGISAISATFSALFRIFGWGLGCCFGDFCDFLLCYQPMAIVPYDNLKIQYFLNKKTKKMNFQKK